MHKLAGLRLQSGFESPIKKLAPQREQIFLSNDEFGGLIAFMFQVTHGVLRDCPLSGSLFVVVMDPVLFKFSMFIAFFLFLLFVCELSQLGSSRWVQISPTGCADQFVRSLTSLCF